MTVPMAIGIGLSSHNLCSGHRRRGEIAATVPKVSLQGEFAPNALDSLLFRHVTICVPFVLVLSPARHADRRAGSTTPLRSLSAIWLAMAALPVSTSHRDAGWHVADPDTDGGMAETCADERRNTVAAKQARRSAPGPPTRSEMDAGGSR
jgi:hypothetical protein